MSPWGRSAARDAGWRLQSPVLAWGAVACMFRQGICWRQMREKVVLLPRGVPGSVCFHLTLCSRSSLSLFLCQRRNSDQQ